MAAKTTRLAIFILACEFASVPAFADIVIGVACPLTGQYQSFGQQMLNGVKAAIDSQNAKGGIGGEQLVIVSADDSCDTIKAEEAAQKLIAAHADVVIGHFCSNASLVGAKLYEKAGISMIAPTAVLPALTESALTNVVRLSTRYDAQGAFAAGRILIKRPNAKLALVDDGTAQMKEITASFATTYSKGAAISASITPDQKDFAELVAKMKAANIDTLYIATAATDAGRVTAQAQAAGLALKRYGPDTLLADQFWEASGPAGESTLVSFPSDPVISSSAKALAADMKLLGEALDGPALAAYAAAQLYFAASAGGPHKALGIAAVLKSGTVYDTILGPMSFNAKGDGQALRFSWFSWNNGAYQTIAAETQ